MEYIRWQEYVLCNMWTGGKQIKQYVNKRYCPAHHLLLLCFKGQNLYVNDVVEPESFLEDYLHKHSHNKTN